MADTPEVYYRNALDLNRFGNGVQKKLRDSYNRIIVDAVEKLSRINEMPLETRPKYKAARLKALLKQTTESLAKWSGKSEKTVIKELQGLAKVQVDFAVNQLEAALPAGLKSSVNSVEVSASYAESVVTKKATDLNASLLSDDLEAKAKGIQQKFSLTAKKGSQITLPNGEVLTKAFRGLASKQADLFGRNIRDGLLSGETTQQMARRLYGVLKFEGGGKATNNQISTLVKTSVQSVSNQAAQTVYEANQDITKEYRWIATLDSRTAPECQILDQTTHKYGQGPEPPQHFGCRCRTTAVLDYKGLGVDPPKYKYVKRSGEGGSVPMGTSYGKWLSQQSASYKGKVVGQSKVKYFNALSKKYGPDEALKKLVRQDGSAKTLKQLEKAYTKTPSKKLAAKPKKTKLLSDKEKKTLAEFEKIKPPSKALIAKEGKYMTAAEKQGLVPYKPLTAAQKKMVDKSVLETHAKKVAAAGLKPEIATFQKLDDSIKNTLENFKKVDLKNKKHQNWFLNQKLFNGTLIPKGKFDTITPKELGKLVEKKELTKLQTKYNKAFKKLLNPTPVKPKAPIKKWDDESFIQKNIGSTNKKTPPPPRLAAKQGKKSTDNLWYKSDVKDSMKNYDMTKAQFDQTAEVISNWTGTNFGEIRAIQIKQAKLVGKQLNPNEISKLRKFDLFEGRNKNTLNTIARDADRMERYIARTPKWKGATRAVYDGKTVKLGDAFYDKQPDGTIFRGMTVNSKNIVEEVLNNIKAGEAVTTMESWSADPRVAIKFAKGEIGRGNHGLVMRHVNKHGTPIEYLNGLNESEILQPSGVRYKLISKRTKTWTKKVDGVAEDFSMTEVVLEAI